MKLEEFLELVEEMRHAQKQYFRTRGNLPECKRLEAKVDQACRDLCERSLFADLDQ